MTRQSQREAVLNALKAGPKTMWQLTVGLNILRPGARIYELRKQGYEITSSEQRLSGKRVVTYTLYGSSEMAKPASCVPERSHGKLMLVCHECNGAFESAYARAKFCGNSCRARHWKRQNHPRTGFLFEREATA